MKDVAYYFSENKNELMKVSDMHRVHLENAFIKHCSDKVTTMSEPEFLVEIKFTTTDDNEAELREKFFSLAKSANIPSIGEKILYNLTVTEIDKDV
tara:strand:+ start:1185 stop:1472 length:288 start_codon:yes stop_codon:yes gene_type:complete